MSQDLNDWLATHPTWVRASWEEETVCVKEGMACVRRQQESTLRRVAGRFISTDNLIEIYLCKMFKFFKFKLQKSGYTLHLGFSRKE